MLSAASRSELLRLLLWLLGAALSGWPLGLSLPFMLVVALAYLVYALWQLDRLRRWFAAGDEPPPEAGGAYGALFDQLYRWQRDNLNERARLAAWIDYLQESLVSLPYGAVMLDAHGDIEWANPAAGELLGLRFPEDRGQPILNLVREPDFVDYFEALDYRRPLDFSSPADRRRYLKLHISFFGRSSRLLFVRDVTQTRKLEQMRKEFVANVSHELRTPLTVINGYLETFSDSFRDTSPRWQRAVQQMLQQSNRMQNLVRDLILLSRLETLPQADDEEPIALRPMLMAIREEALAFIDSPRDIQLDCDDTLQLIGHRSELHSAFSNLVYNAVRYTEPGGSIEIRWLADAGCACLEVRDDGVGIDAEHIPRLTERFYRVDKSRTMDTGGTGLGLAIVKHVLLRHHAELLIRSAPGQGSCFTCRFPLSQTRRDFAPDASA